MSESKSEISLEESSVGLQSTLSFVGKDGEKISSHNNDKQDDEGIKLTKHIEERSSSQFGIQNATVSHAESSTQDEDNDFGFVIIKPEADFSSKSQVEIKEEEENPTPNVIIIQNPEDMNIDGFDPDVLSQVQKVLAESGTDNSVMIVNESGESSINDKETTTYIIDLNSVEGTSHSTSLPISSVNPDVDIQQPQHIFTSLSSSFVTPCTSVFQSLVNSSNESASKTVNSNSLVSVSRNNDQIVSQPALTNLDVIVQKSALDERSVNNSSCTNMSPKNLSHSSHLETSYSSTSESNNASPSTSTVTTSQVAEQLIHIAKKMIEDSNQGSQKISVDESLGKIVISSPESKRSGEKSSSESVITMYLSSPNDLKLKLKNLKTNSPVIVMQAGEELSTDGNKEDPLQDDDDASNQVKIESESESNQDIGSVSQKSDSLVAALSSLTSGGIVYRCSECGYSSHNKHYYKQHVDLVHNEERPYKCPHCDYAGKRRHALLEHMVVHSNQRPYSCNHCNASFRKKGHLTNHVKLHMSHRLVHCGVCNIQLPDAEAFESHLRKIHNTDKLYKCKLCEHTVVDRRAMLTHLATHNESIVFSCPNCPSYFNNEISLLNHMKDTHDIVRKTVSSEGERVSGVGGRTIPVASNNSVTSSTGSNIQPANIVCSECGFICTDAQVMKKHMWVHIDSSSESGVQLKDQASSSKKNDSSNTNSSAMGVLKMNVVSGMKSLPENIVYQCTSCKFTSSDNSVFIKHMLLHKTQRKQQVPVSKVLSQPQQDQTGSAGTAPMLQPVSSTLGSSVSSGAGDSISKERRPDSSVPFVFDQASGRYRCLICGYHCDFQRTIKAHIWKHSGNQNIEYPVFEHAKKPESSLSGNSDQQLKKFMPKIENVGVATSPVPPPQPPTHVQKLKTNPGRVIHLLPFKPMSTKYKPDELIQLKDNNTVVTTEQKLDSVEDFVSEIPISSAENEICQNQIDPSVLVTEPSSPPALIIEDKSEVIVEVGIEQGVAGFKIKTEFSPSSDAANKIVENPSLQKNYAEPNVVVEIVDSVPPSYGLTGMKSQHGSPRVSDLEGSGNETKLVKAFKELVEGKGQTQNPEMNSLKSEDEAGETTKTKYNLRRPKETKKTEVLNSVSFAPKRTAPVEVIMSEDTSPNIDSGVKEEPECSPQKQIRIEMREDMTEDVKEEITTEESDGTVSSDDTVSAGESGSNNPPKAGICSSLLAVIEQLRERSRSESEKDPPAVKELSRRSSKRNKKSSSNSEVVSLSEFHNIEKITEGGGEKFRCSLCHYTSQRICNMKIHMKTHRQKKPSECSLCDFASSSPELLQEHMLLHCKVRTYACKFCPQSFNHKSTLRAHMRAHKDHEPFLCAYCVFETTNPNEYREHMHVHSGCSSRLRCPGCDYIMNSKDELTPHLMKCKGKPPESSASANKGSKKSSDLAKSSKSKDVSSNELKSCQSSTVASAQPTQHSCVVSGCSFSSCSLKELQDHLSIHCNPSLMVCDLCDFKALHSRSLKSHMKRHANDQRYVQQPLEQYKCNLCGYVCHHLPSLKSHMWRHASDQSYSYEFTNDVINAAIDHDSRVDVNNAQPDDPELLVRFINSESRIMEGELTNFGKGDGQRPTCWVTFRCCSCGFETINKAKLNIHMRSHSDIIQQALDVTPRKPGYDKSNHPSRSGTNQLLSVKSGSRRSPSTEENNEPFVPPKVRKGN